MLNTYNLPGESHPVDIFDEDKKKIGEADSIARAARFCRIKNPTCIWRYLFIKTTQRGANRIKGVGSTITGKRYHFKLKQI